MGISYVHAFSFCLPSLMSQLADFILGFSGGFFSPFLSFVVMLWTALVGQRHKSPVLCFPKCSTLSCTCMGKLALLRCLNTSCWVHLARVQKAHQKLGSSSEWTGSLRTGLAGGLQQEPSRCELLFSGQKPTLESESTWEWAQEMSKVYRERWWGSGWNSGQWGGLDHVAGLGWELKHQRRSRGH